MALIHGFEVPRGELTDEQRENNRRWVEALRSGKYKQGQGCLHRNNTFCCLGVAHDVFGPGWAAGKDDRMEVAGISEAERSISDGINAPTGAIRETLGLPDWDGITVKRVASGRATGLAGLNDDEKLTFSQIADIVAYWAGLEEVAA